MNELVKKELDSYLDEKVNKSGALYINGSWGCGKTYFIKKYIDSFNSNVKNNIKIKYVSLNGLSSIEELSDLVFYACHEKIEKFVKNKATKITTAVIRLGLSLKSLDCSGFSSSKMKQLYNLKNVHFVFDDLERCRIELQELFGFINNILDENKLKVVLIGNDVEIKRYLQANEIFRTKLISSILSSGDEKKYKKFKNEIAEPLLYDSIKEKTIYKTIEFVFDKSIIYKNLTKDEQILGILKERANEIDNILLKFNCSNLRTITFSFEVFSDLLSKKSIDDRFVEDIYLNCLIYSILFKNGEDNHKFLESQFFGSYVVLPFKSIDTYVRNSIFIESDFDADIGKLNREYEKYAVNEPPKVIKDLRKQWYLLDDETVTLRISELIKEIKNNKLKFDFYLDAFNYIYVYQSNYLFDQLIDYDELIKIMLSNINTMAKVANYDADFLYFHYDKGEENYIKQLQDAIKEKNSKINGLEIDKKINECNYLIDEVEQYSNKAMNNKKFFSALDIGKLFNTIKISNTEQLVDIRRFISKVYSFSNLGLSFLNDKENLRKFIALCEEWKCPDKIKAYELKYFILDLKEYLKRLDVK